MKPICSFLFVPGNKPCWIGKAVIKRLWRKARLLNAAPVSQEMVLNFISHKAPGLPKSY